MADANRGRYANTIEVVKKGILMRVLRAILDGSGALYPEIFTAVEFLRSATAQV